MQKRQHKKAIKSDQEEKKKQKKFNFEAIDI